MDRDSVKKMWIADQGDGTYRNPILYTDYSDPDVIRVGEDFFMVASSFCNTPAVPVLHSKDLVNWKVISYAMEQLPFSHYDKPLHGCGAWAPAIRYQDGMFYILIPLPDEGIFMVKSENPFDGWSKPICVKEGAGWIDPCPFWDEDGEAYMVSAFAKSRIGFNSVIYISPLKPDCSAVTGVGKQVFEGLKTQPTIEGPKLYKRGGYYYIFAPAGGVEKGWQTVLRSENIWGPYEEKIVLHQGNTDINGPHQGAWVDTPDGQDFFIHFQDVGNAGRIIHLQPMRWENDWPIIGVNPDKEGCGEPVLQYKKPVAGPDYPICAPEDSDFFEEEKLGLQWQWNANYKREWYSLGRQGLTLYAQGVEDGMQLCNVSNLLLQKWPAPEFQIIAKLDFSGMEEGDTCGMISLGGIYSDLAVTLRDGKKFFVQHVGQENWNIEVEKLLGEVEQEKVYFCQSVEQEKWVSFAYSYDGENWTNLGETVETTPGRWVGVKTGLYAIHRGGGVNGSMLARYFVFMKK